jgi:CRP/FNR family transcriptional regulator, cyclic AMP receptor protein
MSIEAIAAPLQRVALFHGLDARQLSKIARTASRVVFKAGDVITSSGTQADAAYLIVSGEAVRIDDESRAAVPVQPGSLVGEMAMLIEQEQAVTVIARGPVRALELSRQAIHALLTDDPAMTDHFVGRINERLQGVLAELRDVDRMLGDDGFEAPAHRELARPMASASADIFGASEPRALYH